MDERLHLLGGAAQPHFTEHGDAEAGSLADGVAKPAVGRDRDLHLGDVGMEREADARGVEVVHAAERLAGRQLPRLPKEDAVLLEAAPCPGHHVDERRHALVERNPVAARARPPLAAQPGVLVVGVAEEIVDAGELLMEGPHEEPVAFHRGRIRDAQVERLVGILRRIEDVRGAEVEDRPQAMLAAQRDPLRELGRAGGNFFRRASRRPVGVPRHRRDACGQRDDILEVERFIVGTVAPGDVELDAVEAEGLEPLEVGVVPFDVRMARRPEEADPVVDPPGRSRLGSRGLHCHHDRPGDQRRHHDPHAQPHFPTHRSPFSRNRLPPVLPVDGQLPFSSSTRRPRRQAPESGLGLPAR